MEDVTDCTSEGNSAKEKKKVLGPGRKSFSCFCFLIPSYFKNRNDAKSEHQASESRNDAQFVILDSI